jgi:hypothetical protein
MTVMWQTSEPATSRVDFAPDGGDPSQQRTAAGDERATVHEVRLEALRPATPYRYRVSSSAGDKQVQAAESTFSTAPGPEDAFVIAAYGDSRSQPAIHRSVAAGILKAAAPDRAPAIVLHTGDIVADGLSPGGWGPEFFEPAGPLLATACLFPVLGNHEANAPLYYDFFSLPAGASGSTTEAWYSLDYGCAHITALDTNQDFSAGSDQYRWLVRDLGSATAVAAAWRFVFFHHPPYSSGYHGGDLVVQRSLVPVFEGYRVAMVLSGHEHLYERSLSGGIHYVVTGGGGAPLYAATLGEDPRQVCAASVYHFCVLRVDPSQVVFEAYDVKGEVLDRLILEAPEPR